MSAARITERETAKRIWFYRRWGMATARGRMLPPTTTGSSPHTPPPSWQQDEKREREREKERERRQRRGAHRGSNVRIMIVVAFDVYFAWRFVVNPAIITGILLVSSMAITAWVLRDVMRARAGASLAAQKPSHAEPPSK